MNAHIFIVNDKTGREIRLTGTQWRHIAGEHPDVADAESLRQALIAPLLIRKSEHDQNVSWYYRFNKQRKRFLLVAAGYLNGEGFVITAYYVRNVI